jgi:hypothetical protein
MNRLVRSPEPFIQISVLINCQKKGHDPPFSVRFLQPASMYLLALLRNRTLDQHLWLCPFGMDRSQSSTSTVASCAACFNACWIYSTTRWNHHITRVILDDDQAVRGLFKDGHKLERSEPSPDLQLREPPMQPAEDTRKVAGDKKNLVSLQVQVAIEHGYEMLSWGYQDVK